MALRISPAQMAKIKEAAAIMGVADQEVIRLATEIGLEHLRRIDYSVARAVVDAVEGKENPTKGNSHPKAA
jgi:hypothetical protein